MPMQALIKSLNAQGVSLFLDNGALKSKSVNNKYSKEVVAKIKSNKAQLIAFLSESKQGSEAIGTEQIPLSDKTELPLSFAQQRLWFIDQLEGSSPQYNMPITLLLSGQLNVAYLQQAFTSIIERHQILRTVYRKVDGQGVQLVQQTTQLLVKQVDLRTTEQSQRKAAAIKLIDQEVSIPFDLANDLMLRCLLIRIKDDEHVLVLTMHHIASDGWSQGILVTEFSGYYRALCEQRQWQSAPLSIQYKDFADWQSSNEKIQLQHQCDYWRKQLADIKPIHNLPLDKPRPQNQQFDGQIYNQIIDNSILDGLQKLAQANGATLFMILEAAFALLIGRKSTQSQVVVGTPVAGRTQTQLEPLIGFFVNTLVLKTQLNSSDCFIDLLKQTRSTTLAAFDHQDVPFEMLVETLKPQRSMSYSPLFQILFALQNNDYGQAKLPGLEVSGFSGDKLINRFELEVFTFENAQGLNVAWNFATALFERDSIQSLADSYAILLTAIVSAPQTPIYQLPLMSEQEERTLNLWQDAQLPWWSGQQQGTMLTREFVIDSEKIAHIQVIAKQFEVAEQSVWLSIHATLMAVLSGKTDIATSFDCGQDSTGQGECSALRIKLQQLNWPELIKLVDNQVSGLADDAIKRRDIERLSDLTLASSLFSFMGSAQTTDYALAIKVLKTDAQKPHYDVQLTVDDAILSFNTAERIERYFNHITAGLLSEFELPVLWGQYLPAQELLAYQQVPAVEFEATTLQHGFEQQAQRDPNAPALLWQEQTFSYGEISNRANFIAAQLQSCGVVSGMPVAVYLQRDVNLLISLLAILKAGGFYVPLDPNYPQERTHGVVAQAKPKLIIVNDDLADTHFANDIALLEINQVMTDYLPATDYANLAVTAKAQQPAYAIFTSGSTGKPKGIAISHHNALSMVHWALTEYNREQLSKVLAVTSICFDLSVFELFVPLSSGGCVVLLDNALAVMSPTQQQLEPTLINSVPSAVDAMSRANKIPTTVTTINLAGEPLSRQLVDRLYQLPHIERVYNLYGPSEDTTYSTFALVPANSKDKPLIGKPIAGTAAYVLDEQLNLLGPGVPGELYLAGDGVSLGYIGQQALTDAAYLPDKIAGVGRMYKTGDQVKMTVDGQLEYFGRQDSQIKIRGFRVELGDIEQTLLALETIKEAVVLYLKNDIGIDMLVAFYSLEESALVSQSSASQQEVPQQKVQAHLRQHLPEHMQPAKLQPLDAMPLMPNGKIDKKALPALIESNEDDKPYRAPASETEQVLHQLWCEYLQLQPEQLSCDRGFFSLGGHSLLGMRLCNSIFRQLAVDVPVRMLFIHDTVSSLAQFIDDSAQLSAMPELVRVQTNEPLPLSFAQQRLWFVNQLNGASSQYNLPVAIKLTGQLNHGALQLALDKLVSRHQVLRTTFVTIDGEGRQQVNPASSVAINHMDLTDVEQAQQQQSVLAIFSEDLNLSFDLVNDLMLRATLIQLAADSHVLLLTMHHIASDGWSMGVVAQELSHFYNTNAALPELPIQYGDYAVWQKECLAGERLLQQQNYWLSNLADLPQLHNLPLDKPRPAKPDYLGRSHIHHFDKATTIKLNQLAQRHDVTLFMLLQSVYALTLSRWSNESDIVIGSPIAGRNHHDLEGLIGFFVNTLLFRHRFDELMADNSSFADLLAQTKTTTLAAFANQDIPFEMLVDLLKPERSISHSPLFQVMFVMQSNQQADWGLDGLTVTPVGGEAQLIKHDLNLTVIEQDDGLAFYWNYATALFDMDTIQRMAQSFCMIVEQLSDAVTLPLKQVQLLSDSQSQLLHSWNQTAQGYALDGTLQQMIVASMQQIVASNSQAIALRQADFMMSYQQLDLITERIAGFLLAKGIGSGARVGLYTERHPVFVIGLLGVLRAGACYVPIDISSTTARIGSIVEDAQISMVLTQQSLSDNMTLDGVNTLILDECRQPEWLASDVKHVLPQGHCNDTAYICYTSGSTGKPKGVEVAHRGVIDYCQNALQGYYSEQSGLQGSLLITSPAFDITVPSIYLPLLRGDCIDIMPQAQGMEIFAQQLQKVDGNNCLIRMTPMHGEALVALLSEDFVAPQAHCFVIGGEAFAASLAKQLAAKFPNSQIYNHYGPTEAVVGCAMFDVTANLAQLDTQLPIGKAMSNTELFVLDDNAQQVPPGVVGELYVGGECVTKGYINAPKLTAEKFVELSFPGAAYQRFYRTGDQVKFDAKGNLWFVGRVDNQVKLRGFRIELGEIEQQISEVAGVEKVVVQATGEGAQKQLLAFVRSTEGGPLSPPLLTNINGQIDKHLPAYMKPDHIIAFDNVPLSANGKANYKALLATFVAPVKAPVLPTTETQMKLRGLWAEVLRRDEQSLSVEDSFFSVGGHSLLIIALFSQIRQHWGEVISVSQLYQYPTIAAQAKYLAVAENLDHSEQLVTLREGNDKGLFIIHPIGGDISCYGALTQQLTTDMTVYGLQHAGYVERMNSDFVARCENEVINIETMALAYLQQIKSAQPNGPYHLLGWSFGGLVAMFVAHLLKSKGETVSYMGLIDSVIQQNQQGWDDFEQRFERSCLQQHTQTAPSIGRYLDFVESQPQLLANFDKAYQITALAVQMDDSQSNIRRVVISNLVAAKMLNIDFNMHKLHYYGAEQTQVSNQNASDNMTALTKISDQPMTVHTVDADHFTIMQYPQVNLLAQHINTDLLLASSTAKPTNKTISESTETYGK